MAFKYVVFHEHKRNTKKIDRNGPSPQAVRICLCSGWAEAQRQAQDWNDSNTDPNREARVSSLVPGAVADKVKA